MIEQNHSYRIQKLKWEIDEAKTEIERGIEKEKSLREKVSLQEEVIRKLRDETPSCSDSMKDEVRKERRERRDFCRKGHNLFLLNSHVL